MSSNLYLFDPKQGQANTTEKLLIQVMHEAKIARAEENARVFKILRAGSPACSAAGNRQPSRTRQQNPQRTP
jgi:hypothetical protein